MASSPEGFARRLERLRADLVEQGRRVQALVEEAFDAFFTGDAALAQHAVDRDNEVDRVDVEVEKASVQMLTDATHENARLEPAQLRAVLTIVKVNNELERIADAAVTIAEQAAPLAATGARLPETFRVIANSTVGILRDATACFDRSDARLAKVVLQSEDCVLAFKQAIVREMEEQLCRGSVPLDAVLILHEAATRCEWMADHCTNIAEQVIYSVTGAIVRHTDAGWVELPRAVG